MYLQSVTEMLVFCLFLFSFCDFICFCAASDLSFEAFRLIQFDNNREPFGSRKTKVEHLTSPLQGSHDLGRNIALVRMQDLTIESLHSLHKRRAQGLLVVLPRHFGTKNISNEFATYFKTLEEYFLTHALDMAVYFTLNDNEVTEQLLENMDLSLAHHSYDRVFHLDDQWLVTGDESTDIILNIQYTNLFGTIKPANQFVFNKASTMESKKYIVICSNHDAFGVVPSLAVGANENGSGVTTLLLLLKWFAELNKHWNTPNEKNQFLGKEINPTQSAESALLEEYHVLFLLTAGGYSNFEGTRLWLEQTEGGKIFLKHIAFVICLDALGIGDDLYLHSTSFLKEDEKKKHSKKQSSKFKKDSTNADSSDKANEDDHDHDHDHEEEEQDEVAIIDACEDDNSSPYCQQKQKAATATATATENEGDLQLFKTMEFVANRMGIRYKSVAKPLPRDSKINVWHHQAFVKNGLVAMTLSAKLEETPLFKGSSILDRADRLSSVTLARNIEFLRDVLVMMIYGLPTDENGSRKLQQLSNEPFYAIDKNYMNNYINFLGHVPRFGPYYFRSPYLRKLHEDMARFSSEVKFMKYRPENAFEKFYHTGPVTMTVQLVKPFAFDLIFMICTLIYCFGLFLWIKKPKSWQEFLDLWKEN